MSVEGGEQEELVLTLNEWVDAMDEQTSLHTSLLGACDEDSCSYNKINQVRQALYACLTCCPESRDDVKKCAGVCYACSLRCHEHHDLVELYTRRSFRCDCPTKRTGEMKCKLNPELIEKQPANEANRYDHNFQGLYCKCKRPYPDPENEGDNQMNQCVICEDWFHFAHIDFFANIQKQAEVDSAELICDKCMENHLFLFDYIELMVENQNIITSNSETKAPEATVVESCPIKPVKEINPSADADGLHTKRLKLNDGSIKAIPYCTSSQDKIAATGSGIQICRRPKRFLDFKLGAVLWINNWRTQLCTCADCMLIYKEHKIEYLLDPDDTIDAYEARGKKRVADKEEAGIQDITRNFSYDKQLEIITELQSLKEKFKNFVEPFAKESRVVTRQDVDVFIDQLKEGRNIANNQ